MPYITETERRQVAENPYYGRGNPGILNYRLTKVLIDWLPKEPHYADFDAAIGALECAKLELYARSIRPYEDIAIERNGEVYPEHLLPEPIPLITDEADSDDVEIDAPLAKDQRRYI